MTGNTIEHRGLVDRFTGSSVIVKIISESACASCHAKGSCTASEMQDKEIEVPGIYSNFRTGDMVTLVMQQSQGLRAVLLAYIYPLIILFSVLMVTGLSGYSDLISGLAALFVLPLYYLLLYLTRNRIRKDFTFSITKLD